MRRLKDTDHDPHGRTRKDENYRYCTYVQVYAFSPRPGTVLALITTTDSSDLELLEEVALAHVLLYPRNHDNLEVWPARASKALAAWTKMMGKYGVVSFREGPSDE